MRVGERKSTCVPPQRRKGKHFGYFTAQKYSFYFRKKIYFH